MEGRMKYLMMPSGQLISVLSEPPLIAGGLGAGSLKGARELPPFGPQKMQIDERN